MQASSPPNGGWVFHGGRRTADARRGVQGLEIGIEYYLITKRQISSTKNAQPIIVHTSEMGLHFRWYARPLNCRLFSSVGLPVGPENYQSIHTVPMTPLEPGVAAGPGAGVKGLGENIFAKAHMHPLLRAGHLLH